MVLVSGNVDKIECTCMMICTAVPGYLLVDTTQSYIPVSAAPIFVVEVGIYRGCAVAFEHRGSVGSQGCPALYGASNELQHS